MAQSNRERKLSREKDKDAEKKQGLLNTITSDNNTGNSAANLTQGPSPMISVSRMSSGNYDKIVESDDESQQSSYQESNMSCTSSELERRQDMKRSNVFLMKVIHGRVPNELLASRITSTDRENLSSLIPHLLISSAQNTES